MKKPLSALFLLLCASVEAQEIEHAAPGSDAALMAVRAKADGSLRVLVRGAFSADWGSPEMAVGIDAAGIGADELEAAAKAGARFGSLPFTCANVVDESTGRSIAPTHVIAKAGSVRVAFIGLTKPSNAEVRKGWRIDDPATVLKALLPTLAGKADAIVLLADMDRIECAALLRGLSQEVIALVPARGTNDPEALRVGSCWLAQSPSGPTAAGRLILNGRDARNSFERVALTEAEVKRVQSLLGERRASGFLSSKTGETTSRQEPPDSCEPGKVCALWASGANRALKVRAHSFRIVPEYGGRPAPEGRAWLVVDSEWTHALPMEYAFDRQVPVTFQIADFREILFVVVNGSRLTRLEPELTSGPGGLTEKEFKLEFSGASRRGAAVFDVPASGIESLDLRFYDFTHGHIALALFAKKQRTADGARIGEPGRNEILEAEVRSLRKETSGGRTPVRLDLRARSVWSIEADATAFDPRAEKGTKRKVPTLGRWEDRHRLVSLVVDGERAYPPLDASPFGDAAILLPDASTGGDLLFRIPEKWTSLELRIDFEAMSLPDLADRLVPSSLTIPLEGKRPAPSERRALVSVQDGEVAVDAIGSRIESKFDGAEAPTGHAFLVVDFRVLNAAEGRPFDAREMVKFLPGKGDPVLPHEASFIGPSPSVRFLPKGERRIFQLVFEVEAAEKSRRVAWGDQVLELP